MKKQVKEAELNLDIKELEDKKESINKKYDDLLSEEKIYAEASKMIQQNKYDEMKDLLLKYGEDFKEISVLLGQSIVDIIKGQLDATKAAYDFLKGNTNTYNGKTTSSSGSSSSSSSGGSVSTGSKVKVTDAGAPIYYTSTSGGNSGTWKGAGVGTSEGLYVVNTNNGRAALSRTNSINGAIGWIEMSKIAKFKIGGDVGNWNDNDGKLAYVHSGERVLTQEQNKMFSNLVYKLLPQLNNLEKSNIFNNNNKTYNENKTNNSIINFNNNYNVTNKTQYDFAKFKLDIEKIIKESLSKAGIRMAF